MRILDSNPMQVLLYVLVVLDAGVVIAEILLDLHAMRSKQRYIATIDHTTIFILFNANGAHLQYS